MPRRRPTRRPSPTDDFDLAAAWPIEGPYRLRPTGSGINRTTRFVDTPAGGYVLCVYQQISEERHVRYEHALLGALAAAGLPFEVPAPLPGRNGDTLVSLPGGAMAALFRVIPGQPPDRRNPDHVRAVGEALGHLHRALAAIDPGPAPEDYVAYGDLDRVHPRVPDPLSASDDLPLDDDARRRLRTILADLVAAVPNLYRRLPRQLCHNDYGPGNTLVVGERVSGVLDFEFAGPDLRALDVATGWYWSTNTWSDPWTPIAAFAEGYRSVVVPTEAELAAAPVLTRLQRATALVHWVGRLRAGQADPALVLEQAERLVAADAFAAEHGARLVETLAGTT